MSVFALLILTLDDNNSLKQFVLSRVTNFSDQASQHRLNQVSTRAQNSSLQAASEVNMKLAAMRKQNQSEVIKITATLHMGQRARNGTKLDKVCIPRMFREPGFSLSVIPYSYLS